MDELDIHTFLGKYFLNNLDKPTTLYDFSNLKENFKILQKPTILSLHSTQLMKSLMLNCLNTHSAEFKLIPSILMTK